MEPSDVAAEPAAGANESGTAGAKREWWGIPLIALLMAPLVAGVIQAWMQGATSRWYSTGGLLFITALQVLLWKRTSLWSRAYMVLTYAIALVGAVALRFSSWDAETFAAGPVALSQMVAGMILAALALSLYFLIRTPVLPLKWKALPVLLGAAFSYPFVVGAMRGIEIGDLFMGEGIPYPLPIYLQPSVLAVGLFLPPLMLLLIVDIFRARRAENRSAFRGFLTLVSAAIPFAVGALHLPIDVQKGLVTRTFSGHTFQTHLSDAVVPTFEQEWSDRPNGVGPDEPFWTEFQGSIRILEAGTYEFSLAGDGQGFLYIDGERMLKAGVSSRSVELTPGVYDIRGASIQEARVGNFSLQWKRPDAEEAETIDPSFLSHQSEDAIWQRSPRQAAQVGVDWLQSASVEWQVANNCFGCHVQGQALMGLAVAEGNQYKVNRKLFDALEGFIQSKQYPNGSVGGDTAVTATAFAGMALAHADVRRDHDEAVELVLAAQYLAARQNDAGEVAGDHHEPPIDQGSMMTTANSLEAFEQAHEHESDRVLAEASARALQYLVGAKPETNQDRIFQILGVARHGDDEYSGAVDEWVRELQALQTEEGGWKEVPRMQGPNAFATGQALYAMKVAGVSVNSPSFKRGVLYLLDTQMVTGLWPAVNSTNHRPSTFAPTMWAVIGLAGSFGALVPELITQVDGCLLASGVVPLEAKVANFTASELSSTTFLVDGVALATVERDGLYRADWDTSLTSPGEHEVAFLVGLANGDESKDTVRYFTGDPFSVSFDAPDTGAHLRGEIQCALSIENPAELPIDEVALTLDDVSIGSTSEAPWTFPCDVGALSDGPHTLRAVVTGCEQKASAEISFTTGMVPEAEPEPEPGRESEPEPEPEPEPVVVAGPGQLGVRLHDVNLTVLPDYIEVVLDMSGSMWGQINGTAKYEIARGVLASLVATLNESAHFGLRVYGHRRKGDCDDSELVIAPGPINPSAIQRRVAALRPIGKTPMGRSLRLAANDLTEFEGTKAIILLTDGIETCGGEPARVSGELIAEGLKLRVHVVGFDVGGSPQTVAQLEEIAARGRGRFFLADSAEQLSEALEDAVQVTYSLFDEQGTLVDVRPVGDELNTFMSGTYRLEVNLDPPLVIEKVVIEKDGIALFDVMQDGDGFSIEEFTVRDQPAVERKPELSTESDTRSP